jgi:DNA segregation ATPase FtsK/SpoIIIE-like protein
MKRDKDDPNAPYAIEARSLIDSLAKLSRAAAINLILATQKIDREVIPTTVQENISGRMAFKANTLQGSLVVLGSKDALDLPAEIRGRGIWQFGSRKIMVQTPLVTEEDVLTCTKKIESDFREGKRKFLTPMIGNNQLQQVDSSDFEKNVTRG